MLVVSAGEAGKLAARSLTDQAFALHTDCSFEDPPPRYFALLAVRADREGGGRSLFLDSREFIPSLDGSSGSSGLGEFGPTRSPGTGLLPDMRGSLHR